MMSSELKCSCSLQEAEKQVCICMNLGFNIIKIIYFNFMYKMFVQMMSSCTYITIYQRVQ